MKLKKVQEQEFNPLPTEFQLTPFEMLMQDIRARNYKLRKVMVRPWTVCRPLSGHSRGRTADQGPGGGGPHSCRGQCDAGREDQGPV